MLIGSVSRQTGIEIATLRKWEKRYGFPKPQRTATGRREYLAETVEQLLGIRRRIAGGVRTGAVLREFLSHRDELSPGKDAQQPGKSEHLEGVSKLLDADVPGLRQWLLDRWNEMAVADFVEQIAAPMAREVGHLWSRGVLPVFAEHLFSEELLGVLSSAIECPNSCLTPHRVLLTTPAGEKHNLGLKMAGAVLASVGGRPIYLHADLPNSEIVAAADSYKVTVVGLSASLNYPPRLLFANLQAIRQSLPESIQLWVGGAGSARLPKLPPNTTQIADMQALLRLVKR